MQRDELQATGTTSSKVLLNVVAVLWGQIRLLKAVDVSRNFVVHRDACFEQNGDFESSASDPHFRSPKRVLPELFFQLFSNPSKMQKL